MPLLPIHVIDFEGNRACGVVEYGVVTLLGWEIVAAKTRICGAEAGIPEAEARVHGLHTEDTLGEPPFDTERDFFLGLRESGPLCAHNAFVEMNLLKRYWPYPRLVPDFVNTGRQIADWGPWIDTLQLYEAVFPTFAQHGLQALIEEFGLKPALDAAAAQHCPPRRRRFHCALYDAIGSALLLQRLATLPGYESISIDWLISTSQGFSGGGEQQELF